jgi:phosphatidylinositol alpha-1,6-mannosyltransferase
LILPRAERVIAVSRFTRSEAIALGADPAKVSVLQVGAPEPVAVPPEEAALLRKALGGGRIVLSVSRLAPHKGHDRLIRAMAGMPRDVHLVIVGDGTARTGLQALAREAGLSSRVTFSGLVSDEQLPKYYAVADCFALLSRETSGPAGGFEGGGIVLVEAAAYGLPIVAAATGGIPETISDGDTGVLVDPDDEAAVIAGLKSVLEDRALSKRLGEAARAMARDERSWTGFVDRLEQVLSTAARRGTITETSA